MQKPDMLYKAADYLRLSKEDGDFSISPGKRESDSISSQRELCERFVHDAADIELVAEFVDDGFTGTNFDRPQFTAMMEAAKGGWDSMYRCEGSLPVRKKLSGGGRLS